MIFRQIKVLRDVLREQEARTSTLIWAVVLTILLTALESVGLGMLLPLLTFVEKGPAALTDVTGPIALVVDFINWLGMPLTFATLMLLTVTPLILRQIVLGIRYVVVTSLTHVGTRALRRRAIAAGLQADLPFFIERKHGDFSNAMMMEPQNAGGISYVGISILMHVMVCAAYFAMMFYVAWELTLLMIPVAASVGVIVRRYGRMGREWAIRIKADSEELFREASEYVRGIRLIKMRAYEDGALRHIDETSASLLDSRIGFDKTKAIVDSVGPLILSLGIFFLLYIAVSKMEMRLSELGFFMFVAMRLQQVLTQLNQDRLTFVRQFVSVEYVRNFVADAAAQQTIFGGNQNFVLCDELRFDDVSFHYPGHRRSAPVLDHLSFSVQAGQMVAIVGRSGVGKSTTADLILRQYDAQEGQILVDGRPIEQFDLSSLRRRIGVVSQDTFLFHETVHHNLVFGLDPIPTEEDLWGALRQAHADEFVRALPAGLNTILGEGGFDLSGGQRQRLSLARALVQKPQMLLLDEPTSALDSESEAAIQDSLGRLHGQLTILVIAHRLATINTADCIYVMESGKVVAEGDHNTLLTTNSTYQALFKAQTI